MLKAVLRSCMEGKTLSESEAEQVMDLIMSGKATASQIASLITIMRLRGETVDEITGFARSMRAHSLTIPTGDLDVVDTCGTGGDNLSTFNISTAAAIVLSALGVPVAKHGNRAVSSKSGSADVLEALGIPVQNTPEEAARSLQEKKLCFLYAPIYHQSMKHAALPRKEIGFRTIFNVLGPLTNPARANYQLIGVYDEQFAAKIAEAISRLKTKRSLIVTGGEGLDELSITTTSKVFEINGADIETYTIAPEDVGLTRGTLEQIQVENAKESAALIIDIFKGRANEAAEGIVILNAAAALYAANRVRSIADGVTIVREAIRSGKAYKQLQLLQREETRQHA